MPIESQSDVLLWLAGLTAGLAAAGAIAAWLLVKRAKRIEEELARLDRLDELARNVKSITERDEDLDVRRLEHVLIDIRDGQRRVEDRMMALLEARAGEGHPGGHAQPTRALEVDASASGGALADRIVTRLLSLGYERIVLVTPPTEFARILREGGAVVVEARRDGAVCKGRAIVLDGRIQDLQIQSAYSTFP